MAKARGVRLDDENVEIAKELFSSSAEHPTPVQATVSGKIPEWFEGTLLRVGPGKFEWGKSTYKHWFDGQSLMHRFQVSKGRVLYSSQFLHSNSYDKSKKYGRVALPGFATWAPPDPCKNIFQRFFLYFLPPAMTDNCNINFVGMKDDVYVSSETPYVYQVDPDTLKTMVEEDLKTTLPGPRSALAHTHEDDGFVYNITSNWMKFRYDIMKIPPKSNSESPYSGTSIVAKVPFSFTGPAYIHSFGLSEHYFIIVENPLVLSKMWKMFFMNFLKYSYLDILKWKPELKSRMHLIDRQTGKTVKTFLVENFFIFHHVNAYEEDGNVVVDVCGYPDTTILKAFYMCNLRKGLEGVTYSTPDLRRYKLPIPTSLGKNMEPENLATLAGGQDYDILHGGFELPRINYAYNGKKYKFAYGMQFKDKNYFIESLGKVDVETKDVLTWYEEHCYPSEPVFVAAANAKEEDDGIVMSAVVGVLGKPSFLLLLDGKTFKEVARAVVPFRLGLTFHGKHF